MKDFHFSIDSKILSEQLTPNAKMLYCSIVAMAKDGFCYAKNLHLAETMGLTARTVIRRINELEKKGYIRRVVEKRNAHKLYPLIKLAGVTRLSHPYDTAVTPRYDTAVTHKEEYNLKREFKNSARARGEGIIKKSYTSEQLNARLDSLTYDDL